MSGLSREERAYQYVLTHATPGDPDSILDAFDTWCSKLEFISNIGPKKGGRWYLASQEPGGGPLWSSVVHCGLLESQVVLCGPL